MNQEIKSEVTASDKKGFFVPMLRARIRELAQTINPFKSREMTPDQWRRIVELGDAADEVDNVNK